MNGASPDDPLGYDVYVREDIEADGRAATGLELVQNAILHRLTTEKLFLADAPSGDLVEFGEDIRKWVGAVETQDSAQAKVPRLIEVLKRDPRLNPSSVQVDIQMQLTGEKWRFIVSVNAQTTTELPIALVIGVDAITVELLSQGK